jgi:hypothetical protein
VTAGLEPVIGGVTSATADRTGQGREQFDTVAGDPFGVVDQVWVGVAADRVAVPGGDEAKRAGGARRSFREGACRGWGR